MSYLAIAKAAAARLRETSPGYAVDALNAKSTPDESSYGVNRVNRVPESNCVGVDYDELARVFGLPVAQLDRVLTLRVAWLDRPLYFVPTEADAAILVASGETTRGAVWTRQELLDLLSMPSTTKGTVKTVALAKFEFDGEATDVRPELGP